MRILFFLVAILITTTFFFSSCEKTPENLGNGTPTDTIFQVSAGTLVLPASTDTLNFQTVMVPVNLGVNDYIINEEDSMRNYHVTISDLKHMWAKQMYLTEDTLHMATSADANNNIDNISFKPGEEPEVLFNPFSSDPNSAVYKFKLKRGDLNILFWANPDNTTPPDMVALSNHSNFSLVYFGLRYKLVKQLTHQLHFFGEQHYMLSFNQ